ncbi:MAG TPA: alpha/beta hydrolase [bacterium]|nr:alpha/beta hydrolase [bacterium]
MASFIGLTIFLYFFQSYYLYRPMSDMITTPDRLGLEYDRIMLRSSDGVNISAWFIPAPAPRGVILFCHSNYGNISYFVDSAKIYHDLGFSTLLFDYRGFGASGGRPGEEGTYQDAEAAWNYLVHERKVAPGDIVIVGRSLGGAVASWLAMKHRPRALALESAFTSFPDLASDYYPYLPVRLIARYDYNTKEYLGTVTCPVLVVHSRDDEIVPYHHGLALFRAAPENKRFMEISGTHNDGYLTSGRRYEEGLEKFLSP